MVFCVGYFLLQYQYQEQKLSTGRETESDLDASVLGSFVCIKVTSGFEL